MVFPKSDNATDVWVLTNRKPDTRVVRSPSDASEDRT